MLNKLKEFEFNYRRLQTELRVVLKNPKISNEYKISLLDSTSIVINKCSSTLPILSTLDLNHELGMEYLQTMSVQDIFEFLLGSENSDTNSALVYELINCGATEITYE